MKCNHDWKYEHALYGSRHTDEVIVRRWCDKCGLVQHAYANHWRKSNIGPDKMWGEYPEGYKDET